MYLRYNDYYTYIYKQKRDCTIAVPLVKALVLPSIPNKQHRSPRRMYIIYRYAICARDVYTHPRTSCAAMFWNL